MWKRKHYVYIWYLILTKIKKCILRTYLCGCQRKITLYACKYKVLLYSIFRAKSVFKGLSLFNSKIYIHAAYTDNYANAKDLYINRHFPEEFSKPVCHYILFSVLNTNKETDTFTLLCVLCLSDWKWQNIKQRPIAVYIEMRNVFSVILWRDKLNLFVWFDFEIFKT